MCGTVRAGTGSTCSTYLQEEAMLDDVIDRLLEVRTGRPGKQVQLTEQEIRQLCLTAKEIFMSQPNLLELEAPIKICGILWVYGSGFLFTDDAMYIN